MLTEAQIRGILASDLRDPFAVLGMHTEDKGISIRAFLPDAKRVAVRERGAAKDLCDMDRAHEAGVFTAAFPKKKEFFKYELHITWPDNSEETRIDPFSFLPVMSEYGRYLFNEGNNQSIYEELGSHIREVDGVTGTVFAVWAPNAKRVSVVGSFNLFDGRVHPMRLLGSSGIWELFIPGIGEGAVYKYEIKKNLGDHLTLKTDPYGYSQEPFPYFGTIVTNLDAYPWDDADWIETRNSKHIIDQPMSIYEVHLGSWRKAGPNEEGDYLCYADIAVQLAEYVKDMGYTHIELMPVQEHPFVPSWGYQVGGFYAVNHRFGTPAEFQAFVNYMHSQGIGVMLDWVSGHFPKDSYGLAQFDGTPLYEHTDPREGEHKDWGTLIFNYGRHEVRNFLAANALYWIEKYHVDGLRVDAVASMLYRNYSREEGEWIPNQHGGAENLEAIEFLQSTNYLVHTKYPGVVTIAEESTAWPMVSRPTHVGGLGFTYKWNMGWMHDTLKYFSTDPIYRKYHQDQITFSLWYAFNENFVLVLSHDEVVHGKKSLLEKMPGDTWQKFANLRAMYGYMFAHPGKKLVFQGGEFGMHNEWFEKRSIDWHTLNNEDDSYHHQGLMRLFADLNNTYKTETALWEQDFVKEGFRWIDQHDRDNCTLSFIRQGKEWHNLIVVVCNFTPVARHGYRIGVPHGGYYQEILNSDAEIYGGAGFGNFGGVQSDNNPCHDFADSIMVTLPPLSVCMFKWRR